MNDLKDIIKLLKDTLPIDVNINTDKIIYNKQIPIAIKNNYLTYHIKINDKNAVVLINKYESKTIKKHIKLFEESLDLPIILVLDSTSSSMKKYLIDNNISFISDDSIYLPQLLIYLNNFKIKKNNPLKKLSKLTQVVLIDLLLNDNSSFDNKPIEVNSLTNQWDVSKMTISRVLAQLVEFDYLKFNTIVRKKYYYINENIDIDKLLTNLNSPISNKIYIKDIDLKYFEDKSLSSYSALSYYTNLTQSKNIYAIQKEYFNTIIEQNKDIVIYEKDYDDSIIEIELWKYKTNIINNNIVDKISLYISLKNNMDLDDVRLENAIDELYEQIRKDIRKSK